MLKFYTVYAGNQMTATRNRQQAFEESKKLYKEGIQNISVFMEAFKSKKDFENGEPCEDICIQYIP